MATIARQPIEILTPEKGTFRRYTETASQSFKKGEFTTLASGKVSSLSGTDPGTHTILGIAMTDAENVATPANRGALIFVPEHDCLFEVSMAGTGAQTDIGLFYESLAGAAGIVLVDKAATTVTVWLIVDIVDRPGQAVTDVDPRVVAKLSLARLQLSKGVPVL